jgi:flagellar hook protein FlgE
MMRSMFAGVSGLKAHQTRMDIIGNNIANVNSAGYKSSRATFQDMLSQTIRAATAPTSARGGTNPQQVGLGVSLGSIDVKHTQGNTQSTGYLTDLAIEGDGFFVLGEGQNRVYTRAGMFGLDNGTEGNLVSLVNGQRVLGYKADLDGKIDLNAPLEALYISASDTISPRATSQVVFAGNLDNRYSTGYEVDRMVQVFDSRGREQTLLVNFEKLDGNAWEWDASWLLVSDAVSTHNSPLANNETYKVIGNDLVLVADDPAKNKVVATSTDKRVWDVEYHNPDDPANPIIRKFEFETALKDGAEVKTSASEGWLFLTSEFSLTEDNPWIDGNIIAANDRRIDFNDDGSYSGVPKNVVNLDPIFADQLEIVLDFSDFTQYADTFTGKFMHQNGYTNGALESYAIDQNGTIVGSFSNGLTRALGQVALARFANPAGLQRAGSTMFVDTPNSGTAQIGAGGQPGYGTIAPSSLEMSNVDLSEEFTDMIVTQRGFQANSRIITSSDEMLQELVNLKR